uniref:Uncharacterized protein n=1 Tax=Ditylenchus dipsaci TaxID=166011 RepID=A0A915E2R0_9BILA
MSKKQLESEQPDLSEEEDNDMDSDSFHSATDGEDDAPESKQQLNQSSLTHKSTQNPVKFPASELSSSFSSANIKHPITVEPSKLVAKEVATTRASADNALSTSSSSSSEANSNNEEGEGGESFDFEKVSSNTTSRSQSGSDGQKGKRAVEAFFKLPHLPEQIKKRVVKKGKNAEKGPHSGSDDEEDDWFKAQLGEGTGSTKLSTAKPTYAMQDEGKKVGESGSKSIWDWTGIQDVVSAVGDSLSNVVESGLGLPNPETMAKLSVAERRKLMEEAQNIKEPEPSLSSPALSSDEGNAEIGIFRAKKNRSRHHSTQHSGHVDLQSQALETEEAKGGIFSRAGLFSGLVSGSLDVLESLGKKTFETLTVKNEGEGESSRRFFLQHDSSSQNLSELLREMRETNQDQAGVNVKSGDGRALLMGYGSTTVERFNTNFVSLFEKSEGMVHLEGLEILAKDQEKRTKALSNTALFEEKLLEFCVEDVSECSTEDFEFEINKSIHCLSLPYKPDSVLEMNETLTQELSLRQAAVDNDEEIVVDAIHEAAITSLAKLTAHSIQALHKLAQLIIIAKNLPEIDSLFAFTYLLCRRLSFFASQYANILSLVESSSKVKSCLEKLITAAPTERNWSLRGAIHTKVRNRLDVEIASKLTFIKHNLLLEHKDLFIRVRKMNQRKQKANKKWKPPKEIVDEVVTNIFFECSNACHYMKKALELLRPFFKKQILNKSH